MWEWAQRSVPGGARPPHLLFLLPRADLQEEVGPESRWGENRCLPLAAALHRHSAAWSGGGDEGGEEQGGEGGLTPLIKKLDLTEGVLIKEFISKIHLFWKHLQSLVIRQTWA